MRNSLTVGVLAMLVLVFTSVPASAQLFQKNKYSLQVNGGYNHPLGELGNWFKGTYGLSGGLTVGHNERIASEIRVHYTSFSKVGDGGSTKWPIPAELENEFSSTGLTLSALLNLAQVSATKPYIMLGVGMYRWHQSRRGNAAANPAYKNVVDIILVNGSPVLPKSYGQYAWGFTGGAGIAIAAGQSAYFDVNVRWDGIMDTLYPVLMIGLERVQPMQMLGINVGVRFLL